MEFRILGALEIVDGDRVVPIAGRRQTLLVCCLVVHAGEVVSRDLLIDALWGGSPPATAANALQVQVHALRRLLGRDRIATEGVGYRLVAEPDEVDGLRFERLARRGAALLRDGDPAGAVATLEEALGLWRGPAFLDATYAPFAQVEIARLSELRLIAAEDRIDAHLELAHHQELLPELDALVREHPTRERLGGQLMLALYRCGRQREALDHFGETRQALDDELGLQPGLVLQTLQQAILRHDPSLQVEDPVLRARRHLPSYATTHVGRAGEIDLIHALIDDGVRLVTLTGSGGVGKTRLAIEAVRGLAARFPDGIHFVDLSRTTGAEHVPTSIARVLGLEIDPSREAGESLCARLARSRMLIVLDNFETVDEAASLVGRVVAACADVTVVVTSRAPLRLTAEHELRVQPLSLGDARSLFLDRSLQVAPTFRRPSGEGEEVGELCRRLDRLPLAIELAAARTREFSAAELLAQMPEALELASGGGRDLPGRQRTLRATIDWSFRLLPGPEQEALVRLAVFAGGWTLEAAYEIAGVERAVLAVLVAASLVDERPGRDPAPRYGMLQSVGEYLGELLREDADEEPLRRRHAEWFAALAEVSAAQPLADQPASAWPRLDDEADNLRAAIVWSHERGEVDLELRLVGALGFYWSVRGNIHEGHALTLAAISGGAGAPSLRARALAGAARLAHSRGAYDEMARFAEQSLDLARKVGDDGGVVLALNGLSIATKNLGDEEKALGILEDAAAVARRIGDERSLAAALNNLAYGLLGRGDVSAGRSHLLEALELCRRIGHTVGTSIVRGNLGLALLLQGRTDEAVELAAEALRHDRTLGYAEGQIYALGTAAAALAAGDEPETAAVILGGARAAAMETGVELEAIERRIEEGAVDLLRGRLGQAALDAALATGAELSLEAAVERALALLEAACGGAVTASPADG